MSKLTDEEIFERRMEPLDYSPSSGSTGVPHHEAGPTEHDGRAKTNTTFNPSEAPEDYDDWERRASIQDGQYANDNNIEKRKANRRRDLATFADGVLTSQEEEYAECLLNYLHENGDDDWQPINDESFILAIMTRAANREDRLIRQEEEFKELIDTLNVERKSIRTERENIREQLS
jgi:hypothetical protein